MKSFLFIFITFITLGAYAASTFAHGGGVSFEEVKDGYFVDIGYQIAPIPYEPIRFDFDTYPEGAPEEEGVFTDVWVRITEDKTLYFSGGIDKPIFGATGLTFAFPHEGTYEILARFQNGTDVVVESSFSIEVLPSPDASEPINPYSAAGVGFAFGGIFMFFLTRIKKR